MLFSCYKVVELESATKSRDILIFFVVCKSPLKFFVCIFLLQPLKESPLECHLDAFRSCLSQMSVKKCLHLGCTGDGGILKTW